ncbi:MAG: M23 family metallopeptidase [Candidatus Dojkabacteria bacterium]
MIKNTWFWIMVVVLTVLGSLWYLSRFSDSNIPEGVVNMEYPLKDGNFRVVSAGRSTGVHESEGEEYALDIARVSGIKDFFKKSSTYGTMVYSPCMGNIKELHDGEPDEAISVKRKGAIANSLAVGCDGFDVYMAHFRSGSFKVKKGDIVEIGDELGEIGNSGYSSGPHLHIMVFKLSEGKRIGTPMTFDGKYLTKNEVFSN